jgi:hypothetical protein
MLLHGRCKSQQLRDDVVILWSHDIDVAKHYAGASGSIWMITDQSKFIDAKTVILLIKEQIMKDDSYPSWITNCDEYANNPDEYLSPLNPDDIVDSAGWWDDTDFVAWFAETFGANVGGVITNNGAVTINPRTSLLASVGRFKSL